MIPQARRSRCGSGTSLHRLSRRLGDLQGAVAPAVAQVLKPAAGQDFSAVVHGVRVSLADLVIWAPHHPYHSAHPAAPCAELRVGEAAGDGGGGALHHADGVQGSPRARHGLLAAPLEGPDRGGGGVRTKSDVSVALGYLDKKPMGVFPLDLGLLQNTWQTTVSDSHTFYSAR